MAILGFHGIGPSLLTLLALLLWVGFWFVGPTILLLGLAMSGGGSTLARNGRILYTTVFVGLAVGGGGLLWFLTRGSWLLRALFLVAPLVAYGLLARSIRKDNAAKQAKADAIYAEAKAQPVQAASPAPETARPVTAVAGDTGAKPDTPLTDLLFGTGKD